MSIGENIKRLRKQRGIKQQEIAALINMHRSNYSKIESGQREISVTALDKIADFFGLSVDEIIHMNGKIPEEVRIEDKSVIEQVKLIEQLDQEDKDMLFRMIDTLLSKKKLKDFLSEQFVS